MSHYEYLLLLLTMGFCGYASYTDMKTQKIRNLCSIGLLYVGTLSQLMACYLGTTTPLYTLGLFCGSGIVAFGFYWFGIFSPGDSKLFWGVCLILPLSLFRNLNGSLSFPPLILALNIIIPYSAGLLGYLLLKFIFMPNKVTLFRRFLTTTFSKTALLEKLLNFALLIAIASVLTTLFERIQWQPDRLLRLLLILIILTFIQKLSAPLRDTPVYRVIVGFLCVWSLTKTNPSVSALLSNFAFFLGIYVFVFVILKQWIMNLANITFDYPVEVNNLQVGMIPAEQIVQVAQPNGTVCYEKKEPGMSMGRSDNVVISPDPAGLDADEISQLQYLAATGAFSEFQNQIKVQPAIRFALIISIGTLLTILCQGPFYLKIIEILKIYV